MIRWNNDYNHGAHPAILQAFADTNDSSYEGYGLDEWCRKAAGEIRKHLGGVDADIHFMLGGTQVNYTMIAAALRPYQGIICADSGHIQVHETGGEHRPQDPRGSGSGRKDHGGSCGEGGGELPDKRCPGTRDAA